MPERPNAQHGVTKQPRDAGADLASAIAEVLAHHPRFLDDLHNARPLFFRGTVTAVQTVSGVRQVQVQRTGQAQPDSAWYPIYDAGYSASTGDDVLLCYVDQRFSACVIGARTTAANVYNAAASTVTIASSTSAKAHSLWTGSANSSPPTDWQTSGFDDSGWSAAVIAAPNYGSTIWSSVTAASATEQCLSRQTFTIPPGILLSATLTLTCDDACNGAYVNGTLLSGSVFGTLATVTISVPVSLLVPGGQNLLAVWGRNTLFSYAAIAYQLDVSMTATGGGSGSVSSVGLSAPALFSVSGSPVTTSGTLVATLATQSANQVFAGPSSGSAAAPAFRAMVSADLPSAPTVSGEMTASDFNPTGLSGSTAATRYVGGTTSGAPASGAHNKGDWIIGQDGSLWICTTAGTPGTWTQVSGGLSTLTTEGDLLYYHSGANTRLPVGANGQLLGVVSGAPAWVASSGATSTPAPAVRATNSATQSIPNTTNTAVTFNTTTYDQGTSSPQHSTSSNTGRLTCQQAGIYNVTASISWASNSTGLREAWLTVNGSTVEFADQTQTAVGVGSVELNLSGQYQLNVGDYVQLFVYQNSGGSLNLAANANATPCTFMMARIDTGAPGLFVVTTQTANYTVPSVGTLTIVGAAGKTMTLPTAVGVAGECCVVKNNASGTSTTVATTSSQTIDGASTYSLASAWASATFVSNGTDWVVV